MLRDVLSWRVGRRWAGSEVQYKAMATGTPNILRDELPCMLGRHWAGSEVQYKAMCHPCTEHPEGRAGVQGWEAVGRLRCSTGLAVERYAGSFYRRTTTDLDFPALHSEHALAIKLRHEEKLTDKQEVFFQFALLFSTSDGQRRIRWGTRPRPKPPPPLSSVLLWVFRAQDLGLGGGALSLPSFPVPFPDSGKCYCSRPSSRNRVPSRHTSVI